MNYPSHYTSFLGGEVSPLFWHRCDMEKFSRWLATAENIRFHNVGAFYNRAGFERMGPTLFSERNPVVKLIPFIFNNNDVFEIEFTDGKFRVRKDGKVVVREDGSEVSYNSPIKIESIQQLKYAQSGDIIFIASGTNPLYELRRIKEDGTEWELKKFDADIMPVGDKNKDKNNKINISESAGEQDQTPFFAFAETYDGQYNAFDAYLTDKEDNEYTVSVPDQNSVRGISEFLNANDTFKLLGVYTESEENILYFYKNEDGTAKSISFSITGNQSDFWTDHQAPYASSNGKHKWNIKNLSSSNSFPKFIEVYTGGQYYAVGFYAGLHGATPTSMAESVSVLKRFVFTTPDIGYLPNEILFAPSVVLNQDNSIDFSYNAIGGLDNTGHPTIKVLYYNAQSSYFSHVFGEGINEKYTHTLSGSIVKDLKYHDVFAVENEVNVKEEKTTLGEKASWTSKPILTNGKWRVVTTGNWSGWLKLEYSIDNQTTWTVFERAGSGNDSQPININKAGEIEHDDLLYIRASAYVDTIDGADEWNRLSVSLYAENFTVNSYYKVISKLSDTEAYVECIKNDIGNVVDNYKWRLPVFSENEGYPEAIGFYQNRLFLAKGYELWSSKINEFWDFYEPVDLSKDDPVNISLLSYRVNDIKSMMTTRSFFVFTTGGEFGIASEGAISQDDKFLKQFSSHGINDCSPLLVGNIVIFVDSSGNTVRAFQYSFENDSYEANDMSVFIEEKLRGKQIITTEYLKNNKECLFLDSDGIVWVFKFFPEQNIMAWGHWKHAKYRITNLCVAPHGAYENLFIVVSTPNGKFIEKLSDNLYYDSVQNFSSDNEMTEVQTTFLEGDKIIIDDGVHKYNHVTGQNGLVTLLSPAKYVSIGLPYISEATLLSPVISTKDVGYTTYNRKKPFKAHFCFSNSYGFKVGIKEEEKMSVDFHLPSDPIDNATTLTSGKKSVLIPSKYDGSAMVSFVQEEPYPMQIENIMLEVDYAGK